MTYPVIVISRDRLTYLEELVAWLESAGLHDITILDNDSAYPPLLEWLDRSPHRVVHLGSNHGPHAAWNTGYIDRHHRRHWIVVTDPDVVPDARCPLDAVDQLRRLFRAHQLTTKIGLSLCIDDLPEHVSPERRRMILNTESHHLADDFRRGSLYLAPVDTTFALYRPGGLFEIGGYRAAPPLIARHLPWYEDAAALPSDVGFYYERAATNWGTWRRADDITSAEATTDWAAADRAAAKARQFRARVRRAVRLRLAPFRPGRA